MPYALRPTPYFPRTYTVIETDLGWVGAIRSAHGICRTTLPRPTPLDAIEGLNLLPSDQEAEAEDFGPLAEQIGAIGRGERMAVPATLDLSGGTPFQQAVWQAVLTIPFGETRSYGWIAAEIGKPLSAHAVGQAVSRNPLPLLIPCHRVVAADGSLGGYGAGNESLPTKRSLLHREGVHYDGPTLEMIRGT
jgi:methylated-DNA-[protein]-cysteine S-methyltransferase